MNARTVYTVGHSNHTLEVFLALLKRHSIAEVADVRSFPHSRRCPWFSRSALAVHLRQAGIRYLFVGDRLGARPSDPQCYRDGRADYELISQSIAFRDGIQYVARRAERTRLALLCAEREPLDCHRAILIAPALVNAGVEVYHILADGSLEEHSAAERRLLSLTNTSPTLFGPRDHAALVAQAYSKRASEISYSLPESGAPNHG